MNKTFPIKIHVSPENEMPIKAILQTMIVNYDAWEEGREEVLYRLGDHLTSNIEIIIDPSL